MFDNFLTRAGKYGECPGNVCSGGLLRFFFADVLVDGPTRE
jgi:hypothetical protein